tara:strand:+ start:1551 stop:1880 length:330 start_codon:yes stop_codon:yes gene_type:complete
MTKTLYFSIANDPSDAADDALLINADMFIAMGPADTTIHTKMYFMDRANTGAAETIIQLTHSEGMSIDVMEDVCEAMSSEPKDGFIVIADEAGGEFCSPHITACVLTQL